MVAIGTTMRGFWSDPYLWIHLAGLAAVPILLELCVLGLAVGDPLLPVGLEVLLVATLGIAPILWMQWQRPFCIFSLMALAVKPERLSETQRQMLQLFRSPLNRGLALATAIALFLVFWQLYRIAPIAAAVVPFGQESRLVGLGVAAIAFLAANLFTQVPVGVARVLLATDAQLSALPPYPVDQVSRDFLLIGWRINQIVPPLERAPRPGTPTPQPAPEPAAAASIVSLADEPEQSLSADLETALVPAEPATEAADTSDTAASNTALTPAPLSSELPAIRDNSPDLADPEPELHPEAIAAALETLDLPAAVPFEPPSEQAEAVSPTLASQPDEG